MVSEDNSESTREERNRYEQHASHCHVSMEAVYLHSDLVPYTVSTQELVFFSLVTVCLKMRRRLRYAAPFYICFDVYLATVLYVHS